MQIRINKEFATVLCLLWLAAATATAAEGDFRAAYNAVRGHVRSGDVNGQVIEKAKQVVASAGTQDEKAAAVRLLAEAYREAKRYKEAAEAYRRNFSYEVQSQRQDRAHRAYEAARDRLRSLEQVEPFDAAAVTTAAQEALSWDDGKWYSLSQKLDLLDFVISAREKEDRQKANIRYLEDLLNSGGLGKEAKVPLMMRIAEQASRAQLHQKEIATYEGILSDSSATPAQRGSVLLRQAEILERSNKPKEALAKAERALIEFDKGKETGLDLGWHTVNGIKWAGTLAREVLLDCDKAIYFFEKMMEYTEGDYWMVPARLELARTYAQMQQWQKAEAQYDAIVEASDEYKPRVLLPRAQMVYYDMDKTEQGAELFRQAFNSAAIRGGERYRALFKLADTLRMRGEKEAALGWFRRYAEMPDASEKDVARYSATVYYEMGRVYESLGDVDMAKRLFRKAMKREGGDMRSRVQARNGLEDILYFE